MIPCNSVSDTSPYSYYTPCPSGPDVSQIKGSIYNYVRDWFNPVVVTVENGYNGDGSDTNPLKAAYDYATSYSTNMQSWRPADVMAKAPVVVNRPPAGSAAPRGCRRSCRAPARSRNRPSRGPAGRARARSPGRSRPGPAAPPRAGTPWRSRPRPAWSLTRMPAGRPAGMRAIVAARSRTSASMAQPCPDVNRIAPSPARPTRGPTPQLRTGACPPPRPAAPRRRRSRRPRRRRTRASPGPGPATARVVPQRDRPVSRRTERPPQVATGGRRVVRKKRHRSGDADLLHRLHPDARIQCLDTPRVKPSRPPGQGDRMNGS